MKKKKKTLSLNKNKPSKFKGEFLDMCIEAVKNSDPSNLDMCIEAVKNSDPSNRMNDNDWVRALKKLIPLQPIIRETTKQDKPENN
jgi:hypothetical protein